MVGRPSRGAVGAALVLVGVGVVVVSLGASAVTAPGITKAKADPGERTVISGQRGGAVEVVDATGETRWTWTGADQVYDATVLDNGSVLATVVLEDRTDCGPYDPPCARTGFRIVDPEPDPHVVYEWTFPVRTKRNSQVHDVELLPSGEFLVTDMDRERVFAMDPDGTVTWEWNASRRYASPPDPTRTDWLHINDVDRIGEGRYLVSVRNANELVVIERGEGVVDVIPGVVDDRIMFVRQHNPQWLGPGAVLVADSEHDRVVELHETNGTWRLAWSLDSAGGLGFDWPRDADRLPNGNTLITDSRRNRVVEVDETGDVVWSVEVPGPIVYEADRLPRGEQVGGALYRSGGTGGATDPSTADLPVFERLHAGLTHVAAVPYWVRPWHLAAVALGAVVSGTGAVLAWTGRGR